MTAVHPKTWSGPRGSLLLGCLRQIINDPLNFYCAAWQEYGDYVRIRPFPGYRVYLLANAEAVERVLSHNLKNYRKPDLFNRPVSLLTGNGILTSEGDFWRRQRRLSQPAFLRGSVAKLSTHMVAGIERFIDEWDRADDGRTVDVAAEMMRLGLRIASTALVSKDISDDADNIGRAYRIAFAYVSRKMNDPFMPPTWAPTRESREFRRSMALLDHVVYDVIESRRRGQTSADDVLSLLLAAQDEESGAGMSDRQLRDEVITLLTAGHETVGAALSWAWWLLGQHPHIQQDVCDEASSHLRGRTPKFDDLPHLPLATAVFEEAMRLYPPAHGMPREAIADDEINGYPVPRKATLILSQWIIHRHPDYWNQPDDFRPERFMWTQPHSRPKFAYFPFGGGPRICIGNQFAMVEGPLVLAALAQRFELNLVEGQQIEPDPTFTLRPKPGVNMVIRKRQPWQT